VKHMSRNLLIATAALLACPALLAQSSASSSRSADAYHEPTPRESMREAFSYANEAFAAGRYDAAIAGYDKALSIDPSQYIIWTNRAMALRMRGISNYKKALAGIDVDGKVAAKKDFLASVESTNKALLLIDALPAPADEPGRTDLALARNSALEEKAASLVIIGVNFNDQFALTDAASAYKSAADFARDPKKKTQLRNKQAETLAQKLDFPAAIAVYKTVLESDPVNVDALLGAFLATTSLPDKDIKAARDYGTRFLQAAPDNDPRRQSVQEALNALPKT
jgi:tetratricopeptide (TPR) repeat protein